jgi:hypothetical protein
VRRGCCRWCAARAAQPPPCLQPRWKHASARVRGCGVWRCTVCVSGARGTVRHL